MLNKLKQLKRVGENFFFQAEDGIPDYKVTGVQTCALPISSQLFQRDETLTAMRPMDLQPIGDELAIKWDDGSESFISLEKLRRACPCAGCKGEADIMGDRKSVV